MSMLCSCSIFTLFFIIVYLFWGFYFDGIKAHPQARKRLRKIRQVRLALYFLKHECSQNTDATEMSVYRAEGEAHKNFSRVKQPIEENMQQ